MGCLDGRLTCVRESTDPWCDFQKESAQSNQRDQEFRSQGYGKIALFAISPSSSIMMNSFLIRVQCVLGHDRRPS